VAGALGGGPRNPIASAVAHAAGFRLSPRAPIILDPKTPTALRSMGAFAARLAATHNKP